MEKEVRIATCVTLTPSCKTLLKDASTKKGISQSAVIELAVREIVERWARESEFSK